MNAVQCGKCGDTARSRRQHELASCLCGAVFTDGGETYQRIGWTTDTPFHKIDTDQEFWRIHHELPGDPT